METKVLEMQCKGKCPHCGMNMGEYIESSDYGSPVRTCRKCGGQYLDRRYHEIEIEGYGANALSVKRDGKIMLLGLAFFAAAFLLNFWTTKSGYYSLRGRFIILIAGLMILFALADAIMIKTGIKEKRLEKKRLESAARLQNPEYAKTLAEFGYQVPDKYL